MEEKREIEKINERIEELKDLQLTEEEYNNLLLEKDKLQRIIYEQERELSQREKTANRTNYNIVDFGSTEELKYVVSKSQTEYNNTSLELDRIERDINTLKLQGEEEYIGDLSKKQEELHKKLDELKPGLLDNINELIENTKNKITGIEVQRNTLQGYTPEMLSEEEMQEELAKYEELLNPLEKELAEYQKAYEDLQNNKNIEIKFSKELVDSFSVRSAYEENQRLITELEYLEAQKNTLQTYTPEMLSEEEMQEELVKFDQKIADLNAKITGNNDKITEIINKEVQILESQIITLDEEKKYLQYSTPMITEEEMQSSLAKYDKQITELEKRVKYLKNKLPGGMGLYVWDKSLTEEQIEELWKQGIVPGNKKYEDKLNELGITSEAKQIKNLKGSLNSHKNQFKRLSTNKEQIEELNNLKKIKTSYDNFVNNESENIASQIDDLSEKFSDLSADEQDKIIDEMINKITPAKQDMDNIKLWNNAGKLTAEAKNDIKQKVKDKLASRTKKAPESVPTDDNTKKAPSNDGTLSPSPNSEPLALPPHTEPLALPPCKQDEKKWLKALACAAGFATGIGLNALVGAVPVVGTAITIYAAGRTIYNAAKLTNTIITKINKGKEPLFITSIKNKIPDKVKKIAEKIFEKPKNPYARWFVNGVSIGYLTDKVFNIHEKIGGAFTSKNMPDTNVVAVNNNTSTTDIDIPQNTMAPTVEIPTLNQGDTIDLSSITHGYASSYGDGFTSLDTSRGVNAIFDKVNVVNGQEWYHFIQQNGAGYAWIPKEQIDELLAQTASVGRSMH